MAVQLTADELLALAMRAQADLAAAEPKDDVAGVLDHYKSTLGVKIPVRLRLGASPEEATARWRSRLANSVSAQEGR